MRTKIPALTNDGRITYCSASEENRGKGRCHHLIHQLPSESEEDFIIRAQQILSGENTNDSNTESLSPIDQLDAIFGTAVTEENFHELLENATPEQITAATRLGFDNAAMFSLPVESARHQEAKEDNDLYFATLPKYGICGKDVTMKQIFDELGDIRGTTSENVNIGECYAHGLSLSSYFEKAYTTRHASIAKTVTVASPGYTARLMFYSMSDIQVSDDCGGDHTRGAAGCRHKYICAACAKASYGRDHAPGDLIGGLITTNLTEPGTQASMKQMQDGGGTKAGANRAAWSTIENTFRMYSNSPILEAAKGKPRHEAQRIISDGLAKAYADCGISIDRFNIDMAAKHMTSERKDSSGIYIPCGSDEIPTFSAPAARGKRKNLFIRSELEKSYKYLTTNFLEEEIDDSDAANFLIR